MEPQQTNTIPVAPQPKPNHKIFYILIFVFIALVGSSVYLFLQNPKKEVAQSVPVQNGVEEWKIYRNEEYGFEFKYPGDWKLDTNKGDFSDDQLLFVMGSDQEYFNVYFDSCAQGTNDWQSGGSNEGGSFLNKKVCYKDITLDLKVGGMSINKEKVALEKILSTFKFLDNADMSNWKIYKTKSYGFEFKYPPYLTLREDPGEGGVIVTLLTKDREPHSDFIAFSEFDYSPDTKRTKKENLISLAKRYLGDNYIWEKDYLDGILVRAKTIENDHYFTYGEYGDGAIEITAGSPSDWSNPEFIKILSTFKFTK